MMHLIRLKRRDCLGIQYTLDPELTGRIIGCHYETASAAGPSKIQSATANEKRTS
jgi:hypothetical protein